MNGAPGFQQLQKQAQIQVLAPQLRQSLKILQAPAIELRNAVLEELQTNPTLEELPAQGISLEAPEIHQDKDSSEKEDSAQEDESWWKKVKEDWQNSLEGSYQVTHNPDQERRRRYIFDSLVEETSLQSHLMEQAALTEATEEEKQALQYLIGSLDDNGFLATPLSEIASLTHFSNELLQRAQAILKSFHPPGIGCTNLQESLLWQLKLLQREESLATHILRDHYPLLLRRRIPELAKATRSTLQEVHKALEEIAALDPAPGRPYSEDNNQVINPDITVLKDNGRWHVQLNSDYIPKLRISETYKSLLAKETLSEGEKDYIRGQMRSGRFLIHSIEQRQNTIERIVHELLDLQRGFFEKGNGHLSPLNMRTLAERLGVHETTISRAIANKYIETPHGVFDLKHFFTSGYQTESGGSVSNTTIKERIAALIGTEDPSAPLSDQAIVTVLANENIHIARRTAAKYREELGILPTHLRRVYH